MLTKELFGLKNFSERNKREDENAAENSKLYFNLKIKIKIKI
jgi:hypothetical protein